MLKCPDCKKWLTLYKAAVTKEHQGNNVQIINVPSKQCPDCGKIFVEDYIYEQIDDFLSFNVHKDILDYEAYEAIEVSIITNVLLL